MSNATKFISIGIAFALTSHVFAAPPELSKDFWQVIDAARAKTKTKGASADPKALKRVLQKLSSTKLKEFTLEYRKGMIALNTWNIYGAGYVIDAGMSADGFHYYRSWILGKGKAVFDTALTAPDDLGKFIAKEEIVQNESLEYAALEVLEARRIKDPRKGLKGSTDDEPVGKIFDEETVYGLYPKLTKQFRTENVLLTMDIVATLRFLKA
jgi:hypothetical protein